MPKLITAIIKPASQKRGVALGLDGAYYFYKNLGIGLTFSFQDQGELSNNDAQALSAGYNADFKRDASTVTAVNRYHNLNLLLGPQYSIIIKKFTVDLRASAGIIKSTSTPLISVDFDYSTNSALQINQLSSTGKAFAYGGSAGLRYSFSDNWDVGIRFNYINSNGINVSNTNNPGTTGRFVTKIPINEFQSTAGLTYRF